MNIDYVMFTPSFPPYIGGVERHVFEIHKSLDKRGYKGLVVVNKIENKIYSINNNEISERVIWIPPKRIFSIPYTSILYLNIKYLYLILKCIFFYRCKVFHFHDLIGYKYLFWFLKIPFFKNKVYSTFHGWNGVYPVPIEEVIRYDMVKKVAPRSINIGDFIQKWYFVKNQVSYGGVNISNENTELWKPVKGILTILYFGRLEVDTGIGELIDGTLDFFKHNIDYKVHLKIFGSGTLEDHLNKIYLPNNFTMSINPPQFEIIDEIKNCDVVFVGGYLSILEGLSRRKLVITYAQNAIRYDYLNLHPLRSYFNVFTKKEDFSKWLLQTVKETPQNYQWCNDLPSWDDLVRKYKALWNLK